MKILVVGALLLASAFWGSQQNQEDLGLPVLDQIRTVALHPSYGCRPEEEFKKGYQETALFLSKYSKDHNSPELGFFSGQCGSGDFFQMSHFDLISDLGEVPIEELTAEKVYNFHVFDTPENYSQFTGWIRPVLGHTYALLMNRGDVRGLVFFTITGHEQNQKLELRYVVRQYELYTYKARATRASH